MVACIRNYQPFPAPHAFVVPVKPVIETKIARITLPGPDAAKGGQERLIDILISIADEGAPLPNNDVLADLACLSPKSVTNTLLRLERADKIILHRYSNNPAIAALTVVSTGQRTGNKTLIRYGRPVKLLVRP